jgi:hypothetical protein
MEYLKPELDVIAQAQDLILGAKELESGDSQNDPPGRNKDANIVGLDD